MCPVGRRHVKENNQKGRLIILWNENIKDKDVEG